MKQTISVKGMRRHPDGLSIPASSKGRYSHHAVSDGLLREWSDGLYLEDQAAYQRFMEDVFAKGVRAMGLGKKKAIRQYHQFKGF